MLGAQPLVFYEVAKILNLPKKDEFSPTNHTFVLQGSFQKWTVAQGKTDLIENTVMYAFICKFKKVVFLWLK